jgi:catechol 2,3-dioxygenase
VHLQVANLERTTALYRDMLEFEVTLYGPDIGVVVAWLVARGYHHVAMNTWLSRGGTQPPVGHTRLHQVAIIYPNRCELARAVERVLDHS